MSHFLDRLNRNGFFGGGSFFDDLFLVHIELDLGIFGGDGAKAFNAGLAAEAVHEFLDGVLLLLGVEDVADAGFHLVKLQGLGRIVFGDLDEMESELGFYFFNFTNSTF